MRHYRPAAALSFVAIQRFPVGEPCVVWQRTIARLLPAAFDGDLLPVLPLGQGLADSVASLLVCAHGFLPSLISRRLARDWTMPTASTNCFCSLARSSSMVRNSIRQLRRCS